MTAAPAMLAAATGSGGLFGFVLGLFGGGGSILAVPLLVYVVGIASPHVAIGTSAVAVAASALGNLVPHARAGRVKWRCATVFSIAGVAGSLAGAAAAKAVDGERLLALFGLVMIALLIPLVRGWDLAGNDPTAPAPRSWSPALSTAAYLAIGVYGGAVQAGVGILLLLVLARAGHGLVEANSIKIAAVAAFTAVAVLVFLVTSDVLWAPAAALA